MKKQILVLLPSLGRPRQLAQCLAQLTLNGAGRHDILTMSGSGGATAVLNSVPMELVAQYEVVGLFNDDTRMRTQGWDDLVLRHLQGKLGLLYGRDGIQDARLPTHPFISSRIVAAVGFIQPKELFHYYGDNFWAELLGPLGLLSYCPDLFTEHLNAGVYGLGKDATTREEEAHWQADSEAWKKYFAEEMPALREKVKAIL